MTSYNQIRVCNIFNTPAHYCRSIYTLMDNSFDCHFVFGEDYPSVKRFDISILKECSHIRYIYVGKLLFTPGMLAYAFKKYDYYIINPATNCVSMWFFLLVLKLYPKKKVYTWTHGMYGSETRKQMFFKKLQYLLCDGEFVYGDYAISLMKKQGLDEKKLFPIHNSLDYDAQLALRRKVLKTRIYSDHFKNDNPVIVMIGRLNKRKKLPMLIEAANVLRGMGVLINVVFIGDGDEKEKLMRLAHKYGIESQMWIYGACYDEQTNAELLYNADISVMPGDIGLTAIHSLMFGVPVITHNCFQSHGPEFEVVKQGVTGDFFVNNDVKSLASSIQQWLQTKTNREDIRKACYDIIDKEWNPYYQINMLKSVLI